MIMTVVITDRYLPKMYWVSLMIFFPQLSSLPYLGVGLWSGTLLVSLRLVAVRSVMVLLALRDFRGTKRSPFP